MREYSRSVMFCFLYWPGWAHWCRAGHHQLLLSFLGWILPANIHKRNNKQPGNITLHFPLPWRTKLFPEVYVHLDILYAASYNLQIPVCTLVRFLHFCCLLDCDAASAVLYISVLCCMYHSKTDIISSLFYYILTISLLLKIRGLNILSYYSNGC